MDVEDELSQWRNKFEECIENPESREEISELVVSLEKLVVDMTKKKVTIDPHIFISWIIDLGLKTTNLEQAIRLVLSGIKMDHISIEKLSEDLNAFRELIFYDKKKEDLDESEKALRAAKLKKKEREMQRKRAKWVAKINEMAEKFESEKEECFREESFDIKKEFLNVIDKMDDEEAFEAVFAKHQEFIDEQLNRIKVPPPEMKIKRPKKKNEKKSVGKVHFDDPYFEVATSSYEEGNVCGLISLNARRDVRGRVLKINGKCNFDLKQHELGKPSWFVRDFHKVVTECLKEEPSKELYRVHSCFPEPPHDVNEPSGFIHDNYKPFVPEIPVDDAKRVYSDCMYINGLSEEDALHIYNIDKDLLSDLNKLTKGEGNFNEVMEKLRDAIPKESLRKLVWSDETFDITVKDNLDKVYNPYHGFETINMEFLPDLTRFEEMKCGKFRKIVDSSGETKIFFGREVIPEQPEENLRRSVMLDASEYLDISQQIHELSMANNVLDASNVDGTHANDSIDSLDLDASPDRRSRMSFVDVSILEESAPRKTDVMNFPQLPRGVDQSHWKYKTNSGNKLPRPKSSLSNKTTPRNKKRGSSTSLSQITPKSSRVLRSQTRKVGDTPLPQIKEEICDDVIIEEKDDDTVSEPGRLPNSDVEEESSKQQNDNEDDDAPSSRNESYYSATDEPPSTNMECDEAQPSNNEIIPETDDEEESNTGFVTPSMEIDNETPVHSDDEHTLVEDLNEDTFECNGSLIGEENNKLRMTTSTPKPSQEIFKQNVSDYHEDNDLFGPFGNIYDEDELKPLFLEENIPKGYENVVTEETAHSFGYMAMKYSANAGKIKCTTSVTYVNPPLVKFAIIDVLSNSCLEDENCESFNKIMIIAKTGKFNPMNVEKYREPFKKCLVFKENLEQLCLTFKSTIKTRIKEPFPNEITINGHHTLRSLYYCVCQIIPQSNENKLHYLTFVNLLLHMNNKFEMTFIDPSTNMEPDGEAPVTCYVKKHKK